jgi:hypothetical protein
LDLGYDISVKITANLVSILKYIFGEKLVKSFGEFIDNLRDLVLFVRIIATPLVLIYRHIFPQRGENRPKI